PPAPGHRLGGPHDPARGGGVQRRRLATGRPRRRRPQGPHRGAGRRTGPGDRARLGPGRHPRVVRARSHRPPGGGQPGAGVLAPPPEGMAASSGLKAAGWPRGRVLGMWSVVVLVSALASAAGYATLDPANGGTGALVEAFAGGALLAMLANSLLPEAYDVEGVFTGPLVVVGFAVSLALSAASAPRCPATRPRG